MKYALSIGINDYPDTDADLSGCVNDAHDWAEVLRKRGFSTELLLDGQATLENMRRRMQAVIDDATHGDSVVITFSGHGTWTPDDNGDEPDGRDEALCPHDVFTNGVLSDDDLFSIFNRRNRGVKLIFISDCCHSGSVSRFANIGGASPEDSKVRFLAPASYLSNEQDLQVARQVARSPLKTLPLRSTALLMAGCQDYEYSYDALINGRFNGAFTYAAQQVLKGLKPEATYRDWMRGIRSYLPSQHYPQSPVVSGTYDQRTWKVLS